jgi:hypothetical protein
MRLVNGLQSVPNLMRKNSLMLQKELLSSYPQSISPSMH